VLHAICEPRKSPLDWLEVPDDVPSGTRKGRRGGQASKKREGGASLGLGWLFQIQLFGAVTGLVLFFRTGASSVKFGRSL
jgi:hypothetical protein